MKTIKKYMRKYTNRFLLVVLLVCGLLLASTAHAQKNFTGDGFGGRKWYKPGSFEVGGNCAAYNYNGQIYMWGKDAPDGNAQHISAIPSPYTTIFNTGTNSPGPGVQSTYIFPQPISSLNNVQLISLNYSGAAIKTDGTGWVWGAPNASFSPTSPFTRIATQVITNCKHLATGLEAVSFVKNDGTVWSVGINRHGQFGNGGISTVLTLTPVQMTGINNAVRVAYTHGITSLPTTQTFGDGIFVLKNDGTVWTAGANAYSAGGLVAQVTGLPPIVDIQGGNGAVYALTTTGDVYKWGFIGSSSLGAQNIVITNTPIKVVLPVGEASVVGIVADPDCQTAYAITETGNLYKINENQGTSGVSTTFESHEPVLCARHVADVNIGDGEFALGNGPNPGSVYLTRDNSYPEDERVWVLTNKSIFKLSNNLFFATNGPLMGTSVAALGQQDWSQASVAASPFWAPTHLADVDLPCDDCMPPPVVTGAGTIDCSKTQLYPAPTAGTASQLSLIVTVNVTTAGCFSPITVSGSGFSINSDFTQQCVTGTGIQQLHIPVNYDGSTLGTLNFSIGQAGGCTADLTKKPSDKVVKLWTLDNCTPMNAGPVLK